MATSPRLPHAPSPSPVRSAGRSAHPAAVQSAGRVALPVAVLAAAVALGGCWPRIADSNAIRPISDTTIVVNPSTPLPAGAVLVTVVVGPTFTGEQVDLRVDGQRFYRANVTTPAGSDVTLRTRFAATPGLRKFFARVGTVDYNVTAETPFRVGAQTCAVVTFLPNAATPAQSRVVIDTPDTCP